MRYHLIAMTAALADVDYPDTRIITAMLARNTSTADGEPLPDHCIVTGAIQERMGIHGKPYATEVELRMPLV